MADCTRKINQELTLLDNPIVIEHAGAASQHTKYCTTSAAEHIAEHEAEHAALRTPTKNITSTASRLLNISMIGAALFNHLV